MDLEREILRSPAGDPADGAGKGAPAPTRRRGGGGGPGAALLDGRCGTAPRAAPDRTAANEPGLPFASPGRGSRAPGSALAELLGSALPRSRAARELQSVRQVGGLRGRRIAEVSLGRLRALPQTNSGCPLAARVEDPERALARSQSYSGPLGRDHGQSVNSSPSDKFVVFAAGGSRNQACAQTTSPAEKGWPSASGFDAR